MPFGIHINIHHHYPNVDEIKEMIMALQADVQALVDQVAANTSAVQGAIAGLQAEAAQIAALQAQIAALPPNAPIDAEDLAAIQTAVTNLKDTNAALQTAVPANVSHP